MRRAYPSIACAVAARGAARPLPSRARGNGMLAAVARRPARHASTPTAAACGPLWTPPPAAATITGLAWSPDGNKLALLLRGQARRLRRPAGKGVAVTNHRGARTSTRRGRRTGPGSASGAVVADGGRSPRRTSTEPTQPGRARPADRGIRVGAGLCARTRSSRRRGLFVSGMLRLEFAVGVVGAPAWSPDGRRSSPTSIRRGLHRDRADLRRQRRLGVTRGPVGVAALGAGRPLARSTPRTRADAPARWRAARARPSSSPGTDAVTWPTGSRARPHHRPASRSRRRAARDRARARPRRPISRSTSLRRRAPTRRAAAVGRRRQGRPSTARSTGLRYTPAPRASSARTRVTYRVSNGVGDSETVRVTVFVVRAPGAAAQTKPPPPPAPRAPFLSARAKPRLDASAARSSGSRAIRTARSRCA